MTIDQYVAWRCWTLTRGHSSASRTGSYRSILHHPQWPWYSRSNILYYPALTQYRVGYGASVSVHCSEREKPTWRVAGKDDGFWYGGDVDTWAYYVGWKQNRDDMERHNNKATRTVSRSVGHTRCPMFDIFKFVPPPCSFLSCLC